MKSFIKGACICLVVASLAVPVLSNADSDHKDWIIIESMSSPIFRVGATVQMDDGNYRTARGQYLVVKGGKVVAKGPDYRRYKADGKPMRAKVRKSGDDEQAGLLLPAVQSAREAAPAPGIEPDEIDAPAARGVESDEIDAKAAAPRAHKPGGGATGATRRRGATVVEDSAAPRDIESNDEPQEQVTGYIKLGDIQGESKESSARELDKSSTKLQQANAGGRKYSLEQMMAKLRPRAARLAAPSPGTGTADKIAAPPTDSKYEIADCGTAVSPMICCHHEAGDGSTCNMFQMLCENAGGTAQGDGTDATCSDW